MKRSIAAAYPSIASRICRQVRSARSTAEAPSRSRQHCLYFLPLPQGQGSLRPGFMDESLGGKWGDRLAEPTGVEAELALAVLLGPLNNLRPAMRGIAMSAPRGGAERQPVVSLRASPLLPFRSS